MNILVSPSDNPYFNLALEEFLISNFQQDFFVIYINKPSVICGKHQIPYKEAHIAFAEKHGIYICRRYSGGGTVYHDHGNLNFSYIINNKHKKIQIDFSQFIQPIYEFLTKMKLSATVNERNNILISGKKVSGNAEHIESKRILHHGTLLFKSDLMRLSEVLQGSEGHYSDKSVPSVRSEVVNISDFSSEEIDMNVFRKAFAGFMKKYLDAEYCSLTEKEAFAVYQLSIEKYSTPQWIYAYSPTYTLTRSFKAGWKKFDFTMQVQKGLVTKYQVFSDSEQMISDILNDAVGNPHTTEAFRIIISHLQSNNLKNRSFRGITEYSFF
jgi:lipoate---protein ligase